MIHLTRVATVSPFCAFLAAGGASVQRQLEEVGIAPELLVSEESALPLRQGCRFVERVARKEGIDDIGLVVGSRASVARMGLFGKTLSQSLTLKDLLEKLTRLAPLVNTGARVWTEDWPGTTEVRVCLAIDTNCLRTQIEAYSLMLLLDGVRIAAGRNWRPKAVWIHKDAVKSVSRFEPFSDAHVRAVGDHAAFALPRGLLAGAIQQERDTATAGAGVELEFCRHAPPTDLIGSLTATLRAAMRSHTLSIEHSAEMLGSSARTLQRRLEGQGVTYRDLLDRVRFDRARQLLREPSHRLADIAWELGYTDASNFTHAFRHWTGLSPSKYRRMLLDPKGQPNAGITPAV